MPDYRIAHREAVTYCAVPISITRTERDSRIPAAFHEVHGLFMERGIGNRGYEVIRYRRSLGWESLDLEVGWIVPQEIPAEEPLVVDVLPGGTYVIGRLEGLYSGLETKTRKLMKWGDENGVDFDIQRRPDGYHWASRYELYLTEPIFGPQGPSGIVDVCLLLRE